MPRKCLEVAPSGQQKGILIQGARDDPWLCPCRAKARGHTVQGTATVSSCFLIWAQQGQFCWRICPARIPDRESPAYPVLILDNFNADGGQSRPLAVVCGSDGTALVCFELADCMVGSSEEQGRSPQHARPWSQTPLRLCSGHHPAPPLLWPSLERPPCPPPSTDPSTDLHRRGHGR